MLSEGATETLVFPSRDRCRSQRTIPYCKDAYNEVLGVIISELRGKYAEGKYWQQDKKKKMGQRKRMSIFSGEIKRKRRPRISSE